MRVLSILSTCCSRKSFILSRRLLVTLFIGVIIFSAYLNFSLIESKWKFKVRSESKLRISGREIIQDLQNRILGSSTKSKTKELENVERKRPAGEDKHGNSTAVKEEINMGITSKQVPENSQKKLSSSPPGAYLGNSLHGERDQTVGNADSLKETYKSNETSRDNVQYFSPQKNSASVGTTGEQTEAESTKQRRQGTETEEDDCGLHSHLWFNICAGSIDVFCNYPLFPKGPDLISVIRKLNYSLHFGNYCRRIFGYIVPPVSGKYEFAMSSDDGAEVWLSEDKNPRISKKICNVGERNDTYVYTDIGDFEKYPSQKSTLIDLIQEQFYFIDIVHIQGAGADGFLLSWKIPGSEKFQVIESNHTRLLEGIPRTNSKKFSGTVVQSAVCSRSQHHHLVETEQGVAANVRPRYVSHDEVKDVLPYCPYKPSYLAEGSLPKGKYISITVYANPIYQYPSIDPKGVWSYEFFPNRALDRKEAKGIVKEYMDTLDAKYPGKYNLLNIINVERKRDTSRANRYLVEVNVTCESQPVVISEYIYKNLAKNITCYPENLQWQRPVKIALVITLKNQGRWMAHFLDNLEDIYVHTGYKFVTLVIFDYESEDIDLERELKSRRLPPYKVGKKTGNYSRTESFNAAVRLIEDPQTIIFMLDLHLELPYSIFDDLRKHCFEGKSVYTPVIIRLQCGHSPVNLGGIWEAQGFGLVGIYKSDWDRIGGLNEKDFKEKWGGEDWDMLDRIVDGRLEYDRLRSIGMLHYQHTRKGMWNNLEDVMST